MATPNMASIERSLQNCSLNHQLATEGGAVPAAETLELNSEGMALPLHWEQCLDLKVVTILFVIFPKFISKIKLLKLNC